MPPGGATRTSDQPYGAGYYFVTDPTYHREEREVPFGFGVFLPRRLLYSVPAVAGCAGGAMAAALNSFGVR